MIEITQWMRGVAWTERPWLVVGKGPTFARRDELELGSYNVLGLNHVIREIDVDVAHMADIDVVADCADRLLDGCRWLLMPRHPHERLAAGRPLEEWFDELPVLRRLDEAGRLVWYNLATGPRVGDSPVIRCRQFGSEVALEVLGRAGVRTVRTLGVDGGTSYAGPFAHLQATRLNTGAPSFDVQFFELDRIAKEHGMDVAPALSPMRVFIGSDESQQVARQVLEHSIRSHTTVPVEFVDLADHPAPLPADPSKRGQTGFSFRRFRIPELCGFEGRALYLDADMQVFDDVAELWRLPFDGRSLLCTRQPEAPAQWKDHPGFHPGRHYAVMLLDCAKLRWDVEEIVAGLDRGAYTYDDLMARMCIVPEADIGEDIPREWNHLEVHEPGRTKLLHYTVVAVQPWKNDDNPLRGVWERAYEEAVAAGAVVPDDVVAGIKAGHLKQSLVRALDRAPTPVGTTGDAAALAAARHHIEVLQSIVERLESKVERLEGRIAAVHRSPTWRVGRAVVGPVQAAGRLVRRRRAAGRGGAP